MRKLFLTAFLVLLFMATSSLHALSGACIDCIQGCPDLILYTNCCNKAVSSILTTYNARRNQSEALCPPGTWIASAQA